MIQYRRPKPRGELKRISVKQPHGRAASVSLIKERLPSLWK